MDRNSFRDGDWVLTKIDDLNICGSFDCGDADINEYFHEDVFEHREALISQTYCLYEVSSPKSILVLLDFCNDVVKSDEVRGRVAVADRKKYRSIPAVKLTRFGVSKKYQGMHIGTKALNLVKKFFSQDNRTGCRFITVDAYNTSAIIKFYEFNEFLPLTEKDKGKRNRAMFFDLITFKNA